MQEARGSDSLRVEVLEFAFDNLVYRYIPARGGLAVVLQLYVRFAEGVTDVKVRNRVNLTKFLVRTLNPLLEAARRYPTWPYGKVGRQRSWKITSERTIRSEIFSQTGVDRGLLQR
jgi:hypothetical protein